MGLMRTGVKMAFRAGILALAAAPIVCAQLPSEPAPVQGQVQGKTVREIDDPHTRERWLLMRDELHPGGPGRLAPVDRDGSGDAPAQATKPVSETRFHPVIHAGDRLIVEEHTPVVDAMLEARALGSATVGSALNARLLIGGKVVRVVALAPGHASLQFEKGVRP
jgi:hypothetical protein